MLLKKAIEQLNHYGIDAIYHMTHIDNVASILEHGLLAHDNGRTQVDISDHCVNALRSKVEPFYGKAIHAYVPFYLNPKNAMLYTRRSLQEDIVIFAFDRTLMLDDKTLFSDGNAASSSTQFYNNLKDLSKLPWDCLNSNSWNSHEDGKRKRMAEVLVPHCVARQKVQKIFCNSFKSYYQLRALVDSSIEIERNGKFYF